MDEFWEQARAIQTATLAARERTGDQRIGTCVKRGTYSVVLVEYVARPKRKTIVTRLAERLSADDAVAFLNRM